MNNTAIRQIPRYLPRMKYYDIGFNLSDPMFQGVYHGKKYHTSDISNILYRAQERQVKVTLLTGSSIVESKQVIELKDQLKDTSPVKLYYTIGVHPCCVNEFVENIENLESSSTIDNPSNDESYNYKLYESLNKDTKFASKKLKELYELMSIKLNDPDLRAIGEIGLDYDRFHYSCKELQLMFFEEQLKLCCLLKNKEIPLFLHMRNCCDDFITVLKKFIIGFHDNEDKFNLKEIIGSKEPIHYKLPSTKKFVVHSFTDSPMDLENLLSLTPNCYIGMNGASFRLEENIESVKRVPLDRLLLETDAPWCEIRRTHEAYKFLNDYQPLPYKSVKRDKLSKVSEDEWNNYMIKSRNEPCTMEQVATVVANIKGLPLSEVVDKIWETSCAVYGA
ncbi:similar to Saccharomyces cerevisiae YBL055C 3'--_5' exonuclease and endonuclease with a possible role in apoptosis [Maudiozyma saulgeensis]|uniref:Similar to Saccharomyces cerevisiae YBL055C 3'-->5' exonuclease and endonuclease with a possible role in apoptosis n=1 Tax=Maudiozyma saulgeensis TaxID=1789683 RepID=A0A1X7R4L5_9SACH|nr:similar to Saccharomyces cerevisiae YBL055C 3'-->5' exonuclease and endonuclease with a possible role in apoptosis [Kazachstania saulgeensis]